MASSNKQLPCHDYHVAWICPVADVELLPARLMLDEEHSTPEYDTHYDENTYICGSINGHTVVVATCPQGETGNVNAGRLTGPMFKTFPNIRMAVLVGIGGGIPSPKVSEDPLENLHLGDVVVGWPGDGKPACVYHERGRSKGDGQFELVGAMQNPDWRLTNALSVLASDYELGQTRFNDQLAKLQRSKKKKFAHPGHEHDKLFKATFRHVGDYESNCMACDQSELVPRPQRTEEDKHTLVFHRGRIATGNAVIQDSKLRDEISTRCGTALCVEMEAAGVDVNRRCLVVRGISDYADSHKSDMWRSYAAGNAAAFTRELLCRVQPATVKVMEAVPEAPWPIPLPRPQSFVGREAQLAQISAHISLEGCRRLAVYGLGGCGKTALALETAYRTREQQPKRAIIWVPAVSREGFEQAYREIGLLLCVPGIEDARANVKQLVKTKLSDEDFGPWLLIVDNADDTGVLFDSLEEESTKNRLIDYLPCSSKGSIIFTTRTAKAAIDLAESNVIEVGDLDKIDAAEMLKTRLLTKHQHQLEDKEVADEFLKMLAFLALAIVQAIAFINKNDSTLSDYMLLYRASERDAVELLSKEFEDQGRYRETKNPVATTWYISFEQIQKQDAVAASYMSFMACTANSDIPALMLPPEGSLIEHTEAVGTLKAYAFITERQFQEHQQRGHHDLTQGPSGVFDVHPLVHLAIQGWLKACSQWNVWLKRVLARLVEILAFDTYDPRPREVWTACLPHALHVVNIANVHVTEGQMELLQWIGLCEHVLGHYRAAEKACRQVFEFQKALLGKEHLKTLISMSSLALTLQSQGKYIETEQMHRKELALREKVLGKEHPETLKNVGNLAVALSRQGKYIEAEQMHRKALALGEKVLGKEHPDTLINMGNLAWALSGQGKYIEAEQMHRKELALREKVLGKEHPNTLRNMGNLAQALSGQGKYIEAEQMHRKALALKEKVIGKEHPETLKNVGNLAVALSRQGKYIEAEQIHRKALALGEKVLGKEHPDTLINMGNLAWELSGQGKYIEAEQMHRKELALREKVLGKEHPETLKNVGNLAVALSRQGKYIEAEQIHRKALALGEKVLGKEHPDTLTNMGNLAVALSGQGKYIEAEQIHCKELALKEKVLGKEHLETLKNMGNLAAALSRQGKYIEAEHIYCKELALSERVLGKRHPNTLLSMHWVAYLLQQQHRYEDALPLYERAYRGYEITLGLNHPTTQRCASNYASAQSIVNDRLLAAEAMHAGKGADSEGAEVTELALMLEQLTLRE